MYKRRMSRLYDYAVLTKRKWRGKVAQFILLTI